MADNPEQYRARAAAEHAAAEAATLDNVRNRCTRAALAWEAMAERYDKVEANRARRAATTSEAMLEPEPAA